jgi:D-lactate dehydrogenase
MMGGVLANNSSGMCCGVAQNAYHTLASVRFVLPSGTELDSADADADAKLRAREPALHAGCWSCGAASWRTTRWPRASARSTA